MGGGSNHEWKKGKRNHGERKMRIGSRPTSTRDVPPLAAGSALGDSDNGDDQVDGDRVEFESVKKSLRVYRQLVRACMYSRATTLSLYLNFQVVNWAVVVGIPQLAREFHQTKRSPKLSTCYPSPGPSATSYTQR